MSGGQSELDKLRARNLHNTPDPDAIVREADDLTLIAELVARGWTHKRWPLNANATHHHEKLERST